jgi:hypothetical protein
MLLKGRDGGNNSMLLKDLHHEYTGSLPDFWQDTAEGDLTRRGYVRCNIIWNDYAMIDTLMDLHQMSYDDAEERMAESKALIFSRGATDRKEGRDWSDATYIWKIEGDLPGLLHAFNELANALDTIPSGDDDVFDYWPNTMTMLEDWAEDLDEVFPYSYRDRVAEKLGGGCYTFGRKVNQIYEKVKRHYETVDETWCTDFDDEVWAPKEVRARLIKEAQRNWYGKKD